MSKPKILFFILLLSFSILLYLYLNKNNAQQESGKDSISFLEERDFLKQQFGDNVRYKSLVIMFDAEIFSKIYAITLSRGTQDNIMENWRCTGLEWRQVDGDYEKLENDKKIYPRLFSINDLYWEKLPILIDTAFILINKIEIKDAQLSTIVFSYLENKNKYEKVADDTLSPQQLSDEKTNQVESSVPDWQLVVILKKPGVSTSFSYVFDRNGKMTFHD